MICIGLYKPKDILNVGSVMRLAANYNVAMLIIEGKRYKQNPTDCNKAYNQIPIIEDQLKRTLPFSFEPVCIEIGERSKSLYTFKHPKNAYYIFGPEDGNLPDKVICSWEQRIFIPTHRCLNLAMCVATVLYDRAMKGGEWI